MHGRTSKGFFPQHTAPAATPKSFGELGCFIAWRIRQKKKKRREGMDRAFHLITKLIARKRNGPGIGAAAPPSTWWPRSYRVRLPSSWSSVWAHGSPIQPKTQRSRKSCKPRAMRSLSSPAQWYHHAMKADCSQTLATSLKLLTLLRRGSHHETLS